MTSLMTNVAAMTALQTLKATTSAMDETQNRVSTGYRVADAKDNAAYWAIATTMRSDVQSMSSVKDSLGIGDAIVDTTYEGLKQAADVVSRIKSLIVTAKDPSVDRTKIQSEISQAQASLVAVANSSSFAGVNWLNTNVAELQDAVDKVRITNVTSGFSRGADGAISLATLGVDLAKVSLFNANGGGMLQADTRSPKTIGGLRKVDDPTDGTTATGYETYGPGGERYGLEGTGTAAARAFVFDGPITFAAADTVSFTATIGAEEAVGGLSGPYNPGKAISFSIDRSLVDSVLPSAGGVVSTASEWASVIRAAIPVSDAGDIGVSVRSVQDPVTLANTDYVDIYDTQAWSGSEGTSMQISGLAASTSSVGGLFNTSMTYGNTVFEQVLDFTSFHIARDVEVNFDTEIYGQSYTYKIDRETVDSVLGVDTGVVQTADDMVEVLKSIMTDVPNLIIETSGSGVRLAIDRSVDRSSGWDTGFIIQNVDVNVEPLAEYGVLDIDVAANPGMIDGYLQTVDAMHGNLTAAASKLGAVARSIDAQRTFLSKLEDTWNTGVGSLVDADMTEESTKLKALQTQQQLGVQALSIANSSSQTLLSLFR